MLPCRGSLSHPLKMPPKGVRRDRSMPLHECPELCRSTELPSGDTKKCPPRMAGTLLRGPRAGLAERASGGPSNIISGQGESPTAQNSRPSQLPHGLKLYLEDLFLCTPRFRGWPVWSWGAGRGTHKMSSHSGITGPAIPQRSGGAGTEGGVERRGKRPRTCG